MLVQEREGKVDMDRKYKADKGKAQVHTFT